MEIRMINIVQVEGDTVDILSRDKDNKRTIQTIKTEPYFFAPSKTGEYKSFWGYNLKKITTNASHEVEKEREKYKDTHESDIRFVNRVLIDMFDKLERVPLRVHYYDMENNMSLAVLTAPQPIICKCVYDTFLKCYNTFVWRGDLTIGKEDWSTDKYKHNVWFFNKEEDMIKTWIKFVCTTDPDVFVGHNLLGFDFIYIINRCRVLGIDINKISYKNKNISYKIREPWNDVDIPGRYVFDTLRAYKESKFKELDSNSLNNIAKEVLKDEKVPVEDFTNTWNTDIKKLIERCRKDVELCMRIDEEVGLLDYYDTMRTEVGCRWEELWRTTFFHDITFLREAKLRGEKLPRKPTHKTKEIMRGGYVYEPTPGVHKNVIVLDLKSLYPYIIKTFNISPETLSPNGELSIKTEWGTYRYSLEKKGICVDVVNKLLNKRVYYKKKMKEYKQDSKYYKIYWWKQEAVKRLANKVFGYLGNEHARLFKIECARSITTIGQEINKFTIQKVKDLYPELKVLYTDTDSIFIMCPQAYNKDECEHLGIEITQILSKCYQQFVDEHFKSTKIQPPKSLFEIEYEFYCSEIFFRVSRGEEAAKKRYVANKWSRDKEGEWEYKYEVKGFETIRSDSTFVEREVFDLIYKELLAGKYKDRIKEIVQEAKKMMRNGLYKLEEIAIRRGVTLGDKKDVYVYAADYGIAYLKCNFIDGKLKMLYVDYVPGGLPMPPKGTVGFEREEQLLAIAPKEEWLKAINWGKMEDRIFITKLALIEKSMGWDSESKKGKQQKLW